MLDLGPHSFMERRGVGPKAAHHFLFRSFFTLSGRRLFSAAFRKGKLEIVFFLCVCVSVVTTFVLDSGKETENVRLESITDALFNSTMPFYFTLGRVGGRGRGNGWEGMD